MIALILVGCTGHPPTEPPGDPGEQEEDGANADDNGSAFVRVPLGTLGGEETEARALNDRGQVAGTSETEEGAFHAFFWEPKEGMHDLGTDAEWPTSDAYDLNNHGVVVGTSWLGFMWSEEEGFHRFGCLDDTLALGINDAGTVVGIGEHLLPNWIITPYGETAYMAFLYEDGECIPLMDDEIVATRAWYISEQGEVTGLAARYTEDPEFGDLVLEDEPEPFVWSPEDGFLMGDTLPDLRHQNRFGDYVEGASLFTTDPDRYGIEDPGTVADAEPIRHLRPPLPETAPDVAARRQADPEPAAALPGGARTLDEALHALRCPPVRELVRDPTLRLEECMARVRGAGSGLPGPGGGP